MVPQAALPRILPVPVHKPRPPTPPRESEIRPYSLDNGYQKDTSSQISSNVTPDSSAESPVTGASRKKVNWPTNGETTSSPIIQPHTASGERKPIKSILKPYHGVYVQSFSLGASTKLSPPHAYPNLAAMLESIAQQLSGDDRDSKLDAYTTLSGTIKASDNILELRALKDKMGTLLQFMRRDLTARNAVGSWDTQLIVNDLVLLSSFLHKPAIAELLTSDFSAYVVDHAIKTFGDPTVSKDVVKHLMFIIARQSFSPKIVNEVRVTELITTLHTIESLVKGKSITTGRLDIYKNLIRNSRSHMLANTDWLEDVLNDMLSSLKDTRTSAIEFGLESSLVLGTENKISRVVMEIFHREVTVDNSVAKFVEFYSGRLIEMVKKKYETSSNVPQIWSVVILFLRCRPRQLEQWAAMSMWLSVIQECFNSSDQQTKLEANSAWNRLVFAVRPDEKTSSTLVNMLCRPLLEQFKRKNKSINRNKPRKATLSSFCVLLYYSFRPNSTTSQLDLYWKQYVIEVIGKTLIPKDVIEPSESSRQDILDSCRILTALFDSTTPRPWKETRAMELSSTEVTMEVHELPALDSKWLRKSASAVFVVLDPLLEKLYWDIGEDSEAITILWKTYITSIASPAVKEVKVSNETMACIASVFNFLYRIWHIGPKNVRSLVSSNGPGFGSTNFLRSFGKIILTTIEGLKLLPFTEKLLSIGSQDTFTVIATPSHGSRNPRGEVRCPLHHLFVLLTNLCPGLEYDSRFSHLVRQIIAPFFSARPSRRARMDFIKDLLQLLPVESTEPCRLIWQVLAEFATLAADTKDGNGFGNNGNNAQPLGMDYRSALKILEVGVDLSPNVPLSGWEGVFEALVTSSTIDAGDGGRAIAVIEPLARAFTAKIPVDQGHSSSGLEYCRILVLKATYPKDSQTLAAARRRLWGAAHVGAKTSASDPYVQLYEYLRACLESSYTFFAKDQMLQYAEVISATLNLLMRCPDHMLLPVLVKLQKGISCWILDDQSKLSGGTPLSQAVTSLWGRICTHLPHTKQFLSHSKILSDLEVLFCAGLQSKHRAIVNSAIRSWNTTFGDCVSNLQYPPQVTEALLKLRTVVDIQLPFFPESLETERSDEHRQIRSFADTQDDSSNFIGSTSSDSIVRKPLIQLKGIYSRTRKSPRKSTPQVVIHARSVSNKRSREETPESEPRKSKKRVSTPRLRHDDSQIQFETVESSPMAGTVLDSQLLTDRQKEVKERQQAEAAMFPDIRSSPRPRERSVQRRSESVELPFHRSSSKSRSGVSPDEERQTTPILIPHVEDDDYVNSSPTPTRALSVHGDEIDPPSSPPETRSEREAREMVRETEEPAIASSPPEIEQQPDIDTTTSVGPSAQIDPFAVEFDHTFSTFEFTPDEQCRSTIPDSFIQAQSVQTEQATVLSELRMEDENPRYAPPLVEEVRVEDVGETPDTPVRSHDDASFGQQTPKTPIFHDALTSPASSGKFTINDEVFQDAISSPRLTLEDAERDQSSSLSDLDESSMLRLMTKFDQGSGRPKRIVRFGSEKNNQAVSKPGPSSKDSPTPIPSTEISLNASSREQRIEPTDALDLIKEDGDLVNNEVRISSPMPSLIPETPGGKAAVPMILVDDEELDPNDTIVVQVPDDFEAYPMPSKKRKPSPRNRISPEPEALVESFTSKKRKQDDTSFGDEVTESPGFMTKPLSPKKIYGRKPRGRPKRLSATPSALQSEIQEGPSVEFVNKVPSIDMGASVEAADALETNHSFALSEKEMAENKSAILGTTVEGLNGPNVKVLATTSVIEEAVEEESIGNTAPIDESFISSDVEVVAETTIEGSSSLDNTSSAIKPEGEPEQEVGIIDVPDINVVTSEEGPQSVPTTNDALVRTEVVLEVPVAQSLKNRLQSLIEDLETAALSREEVNAFEDMFMDAKEQLYGAGRRGRAAGL